MAVAEWNATWKIERFHRQWSAHRRVNKLGSSSENYASLAIVRVLVAAVCRCRRIKYTHLLSSSCVCYILYGKWPWTSYYVRLSSTREAKNHIYSSFFLFHHTTQMLTKIVSVDFPDACITYIKKKFVPLFSILYVRAGHILFTSCRLNMFTVGSKKLQTTGYWSATRNLG